MRKWLARIAGVVLVGGLVALLIYGYAPKPVLVEVAQVSRGPLVSALEAEGQTRVAERYTITAPLAGVVERIELDPGVAVQARSVVARIRPMRPPLLDPQAQATAQANLRAAQAAQRQAQAMLLEAEAAHRLAQEELQRTRTLAEAGAVSRQALDQALFQARLRQSEFAAARSAVRMAGHQVEAARAATGAVSSQGSEALELTSPVEGRVLRVFNESETAVAPGAPLLELGDLSSLEVVVDVLSREAVALQPGMQAWIERWGGERPLPGWVRRIEPGAFTKVSPLGVEEQRVNVVVELSDEPAQRTSLGDGYAVEVRFVLWEGEQVLQVPASATFRRGEEWAVFVVEEGRARLKTVKLGHRNPLQVEVLEGLEEGQEVILHPGDTVEEGIGVRTR